MARASISAGAPPETVLTDVVRAAAGDWLSMLTSDGVTVYAQYAADAWAQVAEKATHDDRRAEVSAVLRDARTRALSAGGAGVAVGLAERALARTLCRSKTWPHGLTCGLSGVVAALLVMLTS